MTFNMALQSYDSHKLTGMILPAIVIDNKDPMMIKRLRARVATLHNMIEDSQLPWSKAIEFSPMGNSIGVGSMHVPVVGAKIAIYFPTDDTHNTYYIGSNSYSNTKIAELLEDYPNTYGHIDAAGNLFRVNTKKNYVQLHLAGGTIIKIDNTTGTTLLVSQRLDLKSLSDINLSATGNINMHAASINMNSGGNPADSLNTLPRAAPVPVNVANKKEY